MDLLKQSIGQNKTNENSFLKDIMGELETHVNNNNSDSVNPILRMLGSLMNSNLLGNIMNNMNEGIQSGDLDVKKLLGSIQGHSNISKNIPDNINEELKNIQIMFPLKKIIINL